LSSDTVTLPTAAMRSRMFSAIVGDSVYDEDPTVSELERLCAKIVGKDKSIYMPSATMSNLCAVLAHCQRGDRVILGSKSHMFLWEQGGVCSVAGCVMHPLTNKSDGELPLEELRSLLPPFHDHHWSDTRLVCLENSHGGCGGAVISENHLKNVVGICSGHRIPVHLDGARLFNAAIALDVAVPQLTKGIASVTVCLSKGLGAPMGSLLCLDEHLVERAKRARKLLGGSLRQVGLVAAAGLEALETYAEVLAEDHRQARATPDAAPACRVRATWGAHLEGYGGLPAALSCNVRRVSAHLEPCMRTVSPCPCTASPRIRSIVQRMCRTVHA
jgi:threonine aldolase